MDLRLRLVPVALPDKLQCNDAAVVEALLVECCCCCCIFFPVDDEITAGVAVVLEGVTTLDDDEDADGVVVDTPAGPAATFVALLGGVVTVRETRFSGRFANIFSIVSAAIK